MSLLASKGTGQGGGGTSGATDGGAYIQLTSRGAMDNYLSVAGGSKSYSGSSTGATEGAYLFQLYNRDKQDNVLSTAGSTHNCYWDVMFPPQEAAPVLKTKADSGFFETIKSYQGPNYQQKMI